MNGTTRFVGLDVSNGLQRQLTRLGIQCMVVASSPNPTDALDQATVARVAAA